MSPLAALRLRSADAGNGFCCLARSACAVSDSGPVKLDYSIPDNGGLTGVVDKFLAGPPDLLHEHMVKASPLTHVSRNTPPLQLLYGCDDTQVTIDLWTILSSSYARPSTKT